MDEEEKREKMSANIIFLVVIVQSLIAITIAYIRYRGSEKGGFIKFIANIHIGNAWARPLIIAPVMFLVAMMAFAAIIFSVIPIQVLGIMLYIAGTALLIIIIRLIIKLTNDFRTYRFNSKLYFGVDGILVIFVFLVVWWAYSLKLYV